MFSEILLLHSEKYPLIQPADIAKLCFQSVFGVSHFISSNCLETIKEEYKSVIRSENHEKFIPIGNGFVRAELCAFEENELSLLSEAFEKTSELKSGSTEGFENLLAEAVETVKLNQNKFSFSIEELESFICEYKRQGFPPVSHSKIYKEAYMPSYRVINEKYIRIISD